MNTFNLKIIACDRVFYDGEATILVFPAEDGEMAIQAHHEQMVTANEIGIMRFKTPDEEEHIVVVSDGMLTVKDNNVVVVVYSAERPEEIDEFRAEAAAERAREQLSHKQSMVEYELSRAALARAMARITGKDRFLIK